MTFNCCGLAVPHIARTAMGKFSYNLDLPETKTQTVSLGILW